MTATFQPYQPSKGLSARIQRRILPMRARRSVPVTLERPTVCFTFDDVPDSVAANALPQLEAKGWASTLYVATDLMGTTNHHGRMMDGDELCAANAKGHEIAAHGHAHIDMSDHDESQITADIAASHTIFDQLDLPRPVSFAWPFGQATPDLKSDLAGSYTSMRGIAPKVHTRRADLNQLGSLPMFTGKSIARIHSALDQLERRGGLMTVFTHDVRSAPTDWGCTPEDLSDIIDHVARIGADVLPVGKAVERLSS